MQLKKNYLIVLACLIVGWVQAQTNCGNISIELSRTNGNCNSNGIITIEVTEEEETSSRILTFALEGEQSSNTRQENTLSPISVNGLTSTYEFTDLASDNYKVIVRKYCVESWDEGLESSSAEKTISISNNYTTPYFTFTEIRKPLHPCINSGIVEFKATGGNKPYKIKVLNGPEDQINREYSSLRIENLPAGNYTFDISDACGYSIKFDHNLTLADIEIGIIDSYITPDEGSCNQIYVPTIAISNGVKPYFEYGGGFENYFDFSWHFQDAPSTSYTTFLKNRTICILTLPDGMRFKDVINGDKTIVVKWSVKPGLLTESGCENKTGTMGSFKLTAPLWLPRYHKFEGLSDKDCNGFLQFPIRTFSPNEEFFCYPINYTIKKWNPTTESYDENNKITGSYEKLYDDKIIHQTGFGQFLIEYTDNQGYGWFQVIEMASPVIEIPHCDAPDITNRFEIPADIITEEDRGTLIRIDHRFDFPTPEGLTIEYVDAPVGFFFKGKSQIVPTNTKTFYVNKDYTTDKYYQAIPGEYKVKYKTAACNLETPIISFTVTPAYFDDSRWDYDIISGCQTPELKPNHAMIYRQTDNYYSDANVYVRIAKGPKGDAYTNYIQVGSGQTLPFIDGPGEYRIEFSGPNHIPGQPFDFDYYFSRTITIEDAYSLSFDYTKSGGYKCGEDGAVITAMAINAKAPLTYTLYDQEAQPNRETTPTMKIEYIDTDVAISFNYSAGVAGKSYWVAVLDDCGIFYSYRIPVYTLEGAIKVNKKQNICEGDDLVLIATFVPGATYKWYKGGTVNGNSISGGELLSSGSNSSLTIENMTADKLADYHVHITQASCHIDMIITENVLFSPPAAVWTPKGNSTDWNDPENWKWEGVGVGTPAACTDVFIPGGLEYYPLLKANELSECNNIYFMQDGQVGRTDLLTYQHAYVQMNMGGGTTSTTHANRPTNKDADPQAYLRFSANLTGDNKISRNEWHMLTVPLAQVYSGDLSFGAYPLTYMRLFTKVTAKPGLETVGSWTIPFADNGILLNPVEGFALWVNKNTGALGYNDYGLRNGDPISVFADAATRKTGLGHINGIVEFPHFDNKMMTDAHRIEKYDGSNSSFYYVYKNTEPAYGWAGNVQPDIVPRNIDNATRLISKISYPIPDWTPNTEIMIANPFMSSLDFNEFYANNYSVILPYYRVWEPDILGFLTYAIDGLNPLGITTDGYMGMNQYIPPLQAFFVTLGGNGGDKTIHFNAADISTVRPADTYNNLRNQRSETNILRITASNEQSHSTALIIQDETATIAYKPEEDVHMLFSTYKDVPQVYTMAEDYATVINRIDNSDILIPLGIKTDHQGAIKFNISGMNNYNASKIEFLDAQLDKVVSISDQSNFNYEFENTNDNGAISNRFFLRISAATTSIIDRPTENSIYVSANEGVISTVSGMSLIRNLSIYDPQGKLLYKEENINSDRHVIKMSFSSPILIVKVATEFETKSIKLINR